MKIESVNPYTEEVMREFEPMTPQEADMAAAMSRSAYSLWRAMPAPERAAYVRRLGTHLRQQKRKYAETITREMGKPVRESLAEIEKCAWLCDYCADNGPGFLEAEEVRTEARKSYVMFQPLGIVLAIMPWNFPFWQALRFGVPAITAGNVVLLKHASNVPQCALAIEEAFRSAGFPDSVFSTLFVGAGEALRLIDEDRVDAVSLTGSNAAGEQVASVAGRRIRKVVLELGGSDPFVVLDDADVDAAAATGAQARMINAGQSCIAAKRFIVMEGVVEEFRKIFIERLGRLRVGDPMDESTDIGPLSKPEIVEGLRVQLKDAEERGAAILTLARPPERGFFFPPCVVHNVKAGMKVLTEEVFGPIAPIITVRDEDEAVRVANDTPFGLGASVWSRDLGRAERLAARIEAGFIAINDMVKSDPRLPFGGVKKSGFGRELSHYGMKEFVNIKTVVVRE